MKFDSLQDHEFRRDEWDAQEREREPVIDFTCHVCGVVCDTAPDPPLRAVCPEHCEDHDYRYNRDDRGHFCIHCYQQAPDDWFLDD